MNFFTNNLAEGLFVVGLILLVIEVSVLGFSSFVLFFVGLAAIATDILLYIGIVPNSSLSALFSMGIMTAIVAIILWRPLKRIQSHISFKKVKNDLVGHQFVVTESVSSTINPKYHYSGVNWALISEEYIDARTQVEVTEVETGAFHIKATISK